MSRTNKVNKKLALTLVVAILMQIGVGLMVVSASASTKSTSTAAKTSAFKKSVSTTRASTTSVFTTRQSNIAKRIIVTTHGKFKYTSKQAHRMGTMILVNKHNYLSNGFNGLDIVPVKGVRQNTPGQEISKFALPSLKRMFRAAERCGIDLMVFDAYRSRALQTQYYNNKVAYFKRLGYGDAKAAQLASTITAIPNTSEHQTGLAVDIVAPGAMVRDSSFAKTAAGKWLKRNSWKYGFCLRYLKRKTKKTEIIFEPWHYRFIGRKVARELKKNGMCLEEYFARLS